jgi:hypothetical protein
MTLRSRTLVVCAAALCAGAPVPAAADGVGAQLKATKVSSAIRLQVTDDPKNPVFQFAWDERKAFNDLGADRVFVASGPINLTLRYFNPIRQAVTITVNDADDPSNATLGKLVESLLATSTVLGAKLSKDGSALERAALPSGCTALADALSLLEDLSGDVSNNKWSPATINREIGEWSATIDREMVRTKSGSAAMQAGLDRINKFLGKDEGSEADTMAGLLKALKDHIKTLDEQVQKEQCSEEARHEYMRLRLSIVYERQETFTKIYNALVVIRNLVDSYAKPARWFDDGPELIIKTSIEPTNSTLKNVVVSIATVKTTMAPLQSAVPATTRDDLAKASFSVRLYRAWVPEIGVGLTFSNTERPKFGTGKNDKGETIIKQSDPDKSNIDPTLMVNFVCGFCGATGLTPMFQVGTSTSKTTPAIFLGGGIRFIATAKGDFGISGGLVVPFAKQLKAGAKPGDVIDGTADLDNKLEWRTVSGQHPFYLMLQYKF